VTSYGLAGLGSIPGSETFFFSPQRPDRLSGPPSPLSSSTLSPFSGGGGGEANNSPPSSAEVKKGGAIPLLPPVCLHVIVLNELSTGTILHALAPFIYRLPFRRFGCSYYSILQTSVYKTFCFLCPTNNCQGTTVPPQQNKGLLFQEVHFYNYVRFCITLIINWDCHCRELTPDSVDRRIRSAGRVPQAEPIFTARVHRSMKSIRTT
jgi:hypothetical protein